MARSGPVNKQTLAPTKRRADPDPPANAELVRSAPHPWERRQSVRRPVLRSLGEGWVPVGQGRAQTKDGGNAARPRTKDGHKAPRRRRPDRRSFSGVGNEEGSEEGCAPTAEPPTKDQGQCRRHQTKDAALPPPAQKTARKRPNCHFLRNTCSDTFFFPFLTNRALV
jgi:hypothetical protein